MTKIKTICSNSCGLYRLARQDIFSKFIVVLSYSVCFMLLTAIASVFFGMLPGYITFEWNSISYLFKKCIEIAILTAFSILPLLAVAAAGKNYTPCMCDTGLHLS